MLLKLAVKSLLNRRVTVFMTVLTLAISFTLLLTVQHLKEQAKESFSSSVSGVDLIVGARSGQLNLLLYSVFRVGNPTNNISWDTYQHIKQHARIAWTVPISLGDSHRGYRVIGTTQDYFEHFKYANRRSLQFQQGEQFDDLFDVVLGAEVARELGYSIGDSLTLSHGMGSTSFMHHDDLPFRVRGILQPTGTPVDKSLHVSLEAIEAIHVGWQHGAPIPGQTATADELRAKSLTPKQITAFLVGMDSRAASFVVQRQINQYRQEPLSAILPGVALGELWQMLSSVEHLLSLVSYLVLFSAFAGLVTMLFASMKERQREIAILRASGARPWHVFGLIQLEVMVITLAAITIATGALFASVSAGQRFLAERFGIMIGMPGLDAQLFTLTGGILLVAMLVAVVPALAAYRQALTQSLAPKI